MKLTKELGSSSVAEPVFSVEGLSATHHYPLPTQVAEDAERKKLHLQERAQERKTGDEMHDAAPKALRTPGIRKWMKTVYNGTSASITQTRITVQTIHLKGHVNIPAVIATNQTHQK